MALRQPAVAGLFYSAGARELRDDLQAMLKFFTPKKADKPEIHGGFARAYAIEGPEVQAVLKEHKLTARCMPLDANDEPGTCIFTGKPATRRVIFAKAY